MGAVARGWGVFWWRSCALGLSFLYLGSGPELVKLSDFNMAVIHCESSQAACQSHTSSWTFLPPYLNTLLAGLVSVSSVPQPPIPTSPHPTPTPPAFMGGTAQKAPYLRPSPCRIDLTKQPPPLS